MPRKPKSPPASAARPSKYRVAKHRAIKRAGGMTAREVWSHTKHWPAILAEVKRLNGE